MGRKKKVKTAIKKRVKKAIDRQKTTNKPRYIAKADRDKDMLDEQPSTDDGQSE